MYNIKYETNSKLDRSLQEILRVFQECLNGVESFNEVSINIYSMTNLTLGHK